MNLSTLMIEQISMLAYLTVAAILTGTWYRHKQAQKRARQVVRIKHTPPFK